MNSRVDCVERFVSAVEQTPRLWRSVDTRVLAIKVEGEWHNLMTRCYLEGKSPQAAVRFSALPDCQEVRCWQWISPIETLGSILDSVAAGELSIDADRIQFRAILAPTPSQAYSFGSYAFSDLSEPYRHAYRYRSCHELTATGNAVYDLVHRVGGQFHLDNAVRVCSAPYDGLDGVARYAIGSPEGFGLTRTCTFEVFAPLDAVIEREACAFEKGRLRYTLNAGSKEVAESTQLGVFGLGPGPVPFSQSGLLSHDLWVPSGNDWRLEASLDLPDWRRATLILRVGPYAVDRAVVSDVTAAGANPRLEAYRLFDSSLSILRDNLTAQGSAAQAFEAAVGRLLGFFGIVVTRLDSDGRLGEAVDMLGHSPSGDVLLAVECTTGALSANGKLAKLVARTQRLRDSLPQIQVRGLIITSIGRAQAAQADLDAAAADRIAVLCHEDLDDLQMLALAAGTAGDALALVGTRVPPSRKADELHE